MSHFQIALGGMGAGVSNYPICNAAARDPQVLAIVSGIVQYPIKARQLQLGGETAQDILWAARQFPNQEIVDHFLKLYFTGRELDPNDPFERIEMFNVNNQAQVRMVSQFECLGVFIETMLAQRGHEGNIGLNLMEKLQPYLVAGLFGYMLAMRSRVGHVMIGAGIPNQVPVIMSRLANLEAVDYLLDVENLPEGKHIYVHFDPMWIVDKSHPTLERPNFFPIVASDSLAYILKTKSPTGSVNGFIVEGPTAGGHNAPPRGEMLFDEATGEPIYGARDEVNWEKMVKLGLPFYIGGEQCSPEKLKAAFALGASGVQIGSAYALSRESGLVSGYKQLIIRLFREGRLKVFRSMYSPSGYPFEIVELEGTLSEEEVYSLRTKVCDLGYLRKMVWDPVTENVVFLCCAERPDIFEIKGGKLEQTWISRCLCNALMANIGLAQRLKDGSEEKVLITLGRDLSFLNHILLPGELDYPAQRVTDYVLGRQLR